MNRQEAANGMSSSTCDFPGWSRKTSLGAPQTNAAHVRSRARVNPDPRPRTAAARPALSLHPPGLHARWAARSAAPAPRQLTTHGNRGGTQEGAQAPRPRASSAQRDPGKHVARKS